MLVARSVCAGLARSFGASTVTLGSEPDDVVCDAAGLPSAQSNAVASIVAIEDAARLDGILMARSPRSDFAFRKRKRTSLEVIDVSREFPF